MAPGLSRLYNIYEVTGQLLFRPALVTVLKEAKAGEADPLILLRFMRTAG